MVTTKTVSKKFILAYFAKPLTPTYELLVLLTETVGVYSNGVAKDTDILKAIQGALKSIQWTKETEIMKPAYMSILDTLNGSIKPDKTEKQDTTAK